MIKYNLEFGDHDKPTGNAIVYWEIKSMVKNKEVKKIIATNFIVSPLLFNKDTIAATFPPIVLDSKDILMITVKRGNIDLIKGEKISVPVNPSDFLVFFKKQLSFFNKIVLQYSRRYAEYIFRKNDGSEELLDEQQALEEIGHLAEDAREAFIKKQNKQLARHMIIKMRQIEHKLNSPNVKYDIENLIGILEIPDEMVKTISGLYTKKFLAIQSEHYETAETLKKQINNLSKKLDT